MHKVLWERRARRVSKGKARWQGKKQRKKKREKRERREREFENQVRT